MHCRTESGSVLLPKAAQDLLLNMSVGNGDMSIPSVYHYLPHLIGKPSSLKPAIKLSQGRAGGKGFHGHLSSFLFFGTFSKQGGDDVNLAFIHLLCLSVCQKLWIKFCEIWGRHSPWFR